MSHHASTRFDHSSANKALILLKHVGRNHIRGSRLTDLVNATGFDKSTTHRLLRCLAEEGLIERIEGSKRYRLGIESVQLGLASWDMAPLIERFRPLMHRAARVTEDTIFLVVRSGDESVYVDRLEGANFVKDFVIGKPRNRRLLGFSAAGICMLASDTDDAIVAMYERHVTAYQRLGMTLTILHKHVNFVRNNGYCKIDDVGPPSAAGIGYGFRVSPTLTAGISIAAIKTRMPTKRMEELARMLQQEINKMGYPGILSMR